MFERWIGETMNGRPSGTCSRPSTDSRNHTLAKPSSAPRTNR